MGGNSDCPFHSRKFTFHRVHLAGPTPKNHFIPIDAILDLQKASARVGAQNCSCFTDDVVACRLKDWVIRT